MHSSPHNRLPPLTATRPIRATTCPIVRPLTRIIATTTELPTLPPSLASVTRTAATNTATDPRVVLVIRIRRRRQVRRVRTNSLRQRAPRHVIAIGIALRRVTATTTLMEKSTEVGIERLAGRHRCSDAAPVARDTETRATTALRHAHVVTSRRHPATNAHSDKTLNRHQKVNER